MSNTLTRILPKIERKKRNHPHLTAIKRWWSYNYKDTLISLSIILAILAVIATPLLIFRAHVMHNHAIVKEMALAHVYKPNEAAYCNHGKDDTETMGAGYIPCTVIQVNNPQHTDYFVSYGTSQANISVVNMRQTVKTQ